MKTNVTSNMRIQNQNFSAKTQGRQWTLSTCVESEIFGDETQHLYVQIARLMGEIVEKNIQKHDSCAEDFISYCPFQFLSQSFGIFCLWSVTRFNVCLIKSQNLVKAKLRLCLDFCSHESFRIGHLEWVSRSVAFGLVTCLVLVWAYSNPDTGRVSTENQT